MRFLIGLMIATAFGISPSAGQTAARSDGAARPTVGLRDNRPTKYALANARVVAGPRQTLEKATILIDGTSIISVGKSVVIPAGFMTIDCDGRTIYPGLIDAYSDAEVPRPDEKSSGHWNSNVTPQRSANTVAATSRSDFQKLRSQGITARVVAPRHGIVKGSSSVVLTGEGDSGQLLLKENVWQHLSLTVPKNKSRSSYPNSPMGAVALLRQTLYDTTWYGDAWQAYHADTALARPEKNLALAALQEAIQNGTFVVDTANERMALRADAIAREFSLRIALRGSGREYRDLDAVVASGRPLLLPVAFAKKPSIANIADARDVSLVELMHWDLAPENPSKLVAAGATVCLTTDGLENLGDFLKQVRLAVTRGLEPDAALAALTTTPAKLLGIDKTVGEVRAGMLANLVITDGDLFAKKTKLLETWVAGKQFLHVVPTSKVPDSLTGRWSLQFAAGELDAELDLVIEEKASKLKGTLNLSDDRDETDKSQLDDLAKDEDDAKDDAAARDEEKPKRRTTDLKSLVRQKDRLTASVRLSDLDQQFGFGVSQLSLISVDEGNDVMTALGEIRLPNGSVQTLKIAFVEPPVDADATEAKETDGSEPDADDDNSSLTTESKKDESDKEDAADESQDKAGEDNAAQLVDAGTPATPLLYPLGAYGRSKLIASPSSVLFRGATIWTCGDQGVMETADVLIRDGKIIQVGQKLAAPEDCTILDARGKHITPGLIDCHSHMATDGGVNESGQAVTAEVRIGDFIDNTDITIYRQLAGGVTTSNILHGSANPIGGQNQVIKLRWGQSMDELGMTDAPQGIKFALGENVKRNQSRYPNTRMGVEQLIRDQLLAAREYDRAWRDYRAGKNTGLPPRRDLQLDAMAEVQRGERWIHCHSYRQDEIVATLDLLEEFGVRIGTLQHILEGYKVADRMKRHGAMASSFSDWWAYKFEVLDAIPYNGALMHQQGIVVSFNSDDRELGRHLNTEAAKAIKYGGVEDMEALKFVTLNPAKQLRIDQHVGSIEPNKHADLVLWSGPPMSTTSRCEQTWIDGKRYFDLESDREMRDRDAKLHAMLIQKVIDDQTPTKADKKSEVDEEDRWDRHDVYCTANGEDGHQHTQGERQR